jgi:2-oxoglutarate dehydrogenase E1 component
MEDISNSDRIDPASLLFVEEIYEEYRQDPHSVADSWREFFLQLESSNGSKGLFVSHAAVQRELIEHARWAKPKAAEAVRATTGDRDTNPDKQSAVLRLINAYRLLGHVRAKTDPIPFFEKPSVPDLNPEFQGLSPSDMELVFETGTLHGPDERKLRDIVELLSETYTGSIGLEYMHITNRDQKKWIQERMESNRARPQLDSERRLHLLQRLTAAEGLERYLHIRFSGQKRFSVEGSESLIPLLDELIWRGGTLGVKEVVLGMAHRGRLNVLVNIMGKQPRALMEEFEGKNAKLDDVMTGDVKYHQGFSSDVMTPGGPVHLALAFNPSHLEIINPVVEGSARARQDRRKDRERRLCQPILIHGDAAIAGQGVVFETVNLGGTRGYSSGGTIHIVVNNQIGFTTSNPLDTRSSLYCTDVGKIVQAPILHVNGDDPEAVIFAAQFAVDFRMAFRKDVFIDMISYRRHGHNEGDEPAATQPMMYAKIRQHPSVLKVYSEKMIRSGLIDQAGVQAFASSFRTALDEGDAVTHNPADSKDYTYLAQWSPYLNNHWRDPVKSTVTMRKLKSLGKKVCEYPDDLKLHHGVAKIMADRKAMCTGKQPLDWGCAETLAYASLLKEGYSVRFSGQDSCRGTFFHRHAVLHDQETGEKYRPLEYLAENQPRFQIIDSILSEEAVLGFEYGYSTTDPNCLVIWEAQYGDFANGAQVVMDQFISSSQQKWNLFSGLVMMLPHGWEGQGPEHSSARLERYLQLCAQDNMQVCVPSSAAQMFHMLRRQMVRPIRIPLIIMSPKSMLRRKDSFSTLEDLVEGKFELLIGEVDKKIKRNDVKRVVFCSGKVYYEIVKRREEEGITDTVILRIEQLYPFPEKEYKAHLGRYPNATEVVWAQEEPMNQGAWYQIQHRLREGLKDQQDVEYAGRIACSAPAGGSYKKHMERENLLIEDALGIGRRSASRKKAKKASAKRTSKKK